MSAPDRTVASLDDYRTDAGSLLRRLMAESRRLNLMVEVTYAPVSDRVCVTVYAASIDLNTEPATVYVDHPAVEAAMTAALEEMEML
ncbi:hypothetical protein [Williamsia phyllosphaerae]|uniref:Ribosome-binding factor A n=1 Tax=Williamsia phyllosphaerae TaxID=885042 RepID=A0ABQ1V4P7_9NOCA|nr:hypothetical protein [Williamsia phyllosphaerae]GGF38828.1 hypothetical protein GCM10007298_38170 [Williamsia phyllosphaerae]